MAPTKLTSDRSTGTLDFTPAGGETDGESRIPTAAAGAEHPGITEMHARKYRIAGDLVNRSTADLPDDQRSALRWLHLHARENDFSLEDLALRLKKADRSSYSKDSVYQALTGRREAGLGQLCASITAYRDYFERESKAVKSGFIETTLTQAIHRICRRALIRHRIAFIFGESQVGKTTALEEYARANNHGETVFARMPTGGSMSNFLEELAIALGISAQQKEKELRRRIISAFDARMLLIIDECHQCFRSQYSNRSILSLEFAREIHDKRKCGLVLCGTNIFRDEIKRGRNAGILRQLWLRMLAPLQLPDMPTAGQLAVFAAAYHLPPAPQRNLKVRTQELIGDDMQDVERTTNPFELQMQTVKSDGLGRWIAILQEASDLAAEKNQRITWGHVIAAHAVFKAMETIEESA